MPFSTLRMLMLGETGSGKSSLGNTIIGSRVFQTSGLSGSSTRDIQRQSGFLFDQPVEIVDTPGLYDTDRTHQQTAAVLARAMTPGPHVILYVIPIGRFTEQNFKTFQRTKEYFGNHITSHMLVVFTNGDKLREECISMGQFLNTASPYLRRVLADVMTRYVVFNNKVFDDGQVCGLIAAVISLTATTNNRPFRMRGNTRNISDRVTAADQVEVANTPTGQRLQSNNTKLKIALGVTGVVAVGAGGYFLWPTISGALSSTATAKAAVDAAAAVAVTGETAAATGTTAAVAGEVAAVTGTTAAVAGEVAAVTGTTAAVAGEVAAVTGTTAAVAGEVAAVTGTAAAATGTGVAYAGIAALGLPVSSVSPFFGGALALYVSLASGPFRT